VRPVRAYERIVEQVEEAVLRRELLPGERLPSERELVAQFAVSRGTVREALRVLESNGVVRSRPGDPNGPEVLPFSLASLRKQMVRLARVEELTLGELVAFRMVLDGSAALLAARTRTAEQLAALEEAVAVMRAAAQEGPRRFSETDVAFHEALTRAAGNPLLVLVAEVVRTVVAGLIAKGLDDACDSRSAMEEYVSRHVELLEAVRRGDGAQASRLARTQLLEAYGPHVTGPERGVLHALVDDATEPGSRDDQHP
jgi:DNA-binding FadR family transcriptional regulator